jgi:hypothetical protein
MFQRILELMTKFEIEAGRKVTFLCFQNPTYHKMQQTSELSNFIFIFLQYFATLPYLHYRALRDMMIEALLVATARKHSWLEQDVC